MLKITTSLLLILCALTFFWSLGAPPIADSDEAFYAEGAREILESSDWLTPRFNYINRFEKPILYYWLAAASYKIFGLSEFSARLPSALSALGLSLFINWNTVIQPKNRLDRCNHHRFQLWSHTYRTAGTTRSTPCLFYQSYNMECFSYMASPRATNFLGSQSSTNTVALVHNLRFIRRCRILNEGSSRNRFANINSYSLSSHTIFH